MRLLERKPDGDLVLREFTSKDVPPYAILSHNWGRDEVSFQEVEAGTGRNKAGWKKINFCAKQANADGLRYIWVDTCCIDKKNAVELSEAINSMFRWYQKAARCYVYLSDVSIDGELGQSKCEWEVDFRESRWFTRGWTLQELIAPASVEFFSLEGRRLGNKITLEPTIHEITGISASVLRGDALSNFTIDERMSWAEHRNTTVEEDKAYCLLGIFDVSMPLIYGEGTNKASRRLKEEIHKSYKGTDFDRFAVGLNLLAIPEAVQFVARETELSEMYQLLHRPSARSAVVLHGLGGIGKTQLAIEYARRHKEKYTAIFWLNANDKNSLKLSFRDIAQQVLMHQPSTTVLASVNLDEDLDQVMSAVKAWLDLQKNTRWLMIYDNYDNPRTPGNPDDSTVDIRQFLPRSDHGSIIITTRSSQVSQGRRIHVQKLGSIQEGLEILSNTSKRESINNDPDAIVLVKELDGLPLALATAGAYLEHVTTSFSDYLRLYKASWLKLLTTSPQLSSYEDRKLYTTWQITFDRIEQQNAASAKLLKLWAYFDRQDVWFELLRHANSADDEWIQKLTEDELNFNEAVTLLCSFGLVDSDRPLMQQFGPDTYSVHSCVHSWSVFILNKEWDDSLARLALTCVASEVPGINERDWLLLQRRLLQHATQLDLFIGDGKMDIAGLSWALNNLGTLFSIQGKLAEAEEMYIRAIQDCEDALGPKHKCTLDTVNNLAILYEKQGKLAEVEEMYIRVLQGCKEEALGPKHISTLKTVSNLAVLYSDQGKLAEADEMYMQALQGKEEALGPKHISTLKTVSNLAVLYSDQGKLAEADEMYMQALQGKEEALGPKHTSTLQTVNNLAIHYFDQGKLAEAEEIFIRALQGKEEALGPKHISTLKTVSNLAVLYESQGKLDEAEKMHVRALQGYEDTLGPGLVSSYLPAVHTMCALGDFFSQTGRKDMAKTMYNRALSGYTAVLGPSSERVGEIERRLQALQLTPAETETQHTPTEIRTSETKSPLQRLFRKLRI
ncbi:hypothetical protein NA57DRAFT_35802 [Rhizodiscina lignyota]|uniref:HET-domain-containing protein n=1 Tax=Rhizodiscina lignyota TaxID=1504668 RepID=A0A9P4MDG8_9PEZI|nr:hypothetical protein NA57DRAFT_35802 [Rhizodiscina lignyota]